jgi:uncharacterized membrane protein
MDYYLLALRVIHIGSGVFWAGATWAVAGFLTPAVKSTGTGGQQVMQFVVRRRRLTEIFSLAAILTSAAGLLLYWHDSGGFNPAWTRTVPGLALTFGGLAGLATFVIGFFVNRPVSRRMGTLAAQIGTQSPPDPALISDMLSLQARLERAGIWAAVLLALAVLGMAAAQVMVV